MVVYFILYAAYVGTGYVKLPYKGKKEAGGGYTITGKRPIPDQAHVGNKQKSIPIVQIWNVFSKVFLRMPIYNKVIVHVLTLKFWDTKKTRDYWNKLGGKTQ